MKSLTLKTIQIIDRFFDVEKKETVMSMLIDECGNNLPFCEKLSITELERIHFAVIKISNGDITQLKSATQMAQTDWRDLLVCADFAHNLNAHNIWADTVLQASSYR